MDYTEINSHLNGVQSALVSTAMDLQRANVGYDGIQNLVEKQLDLIKAVCDQLEVLEKRLEKIERDNAL